MFRVAHGDSKMHGDGAVDYYLSHAFTLTFSAPITMKQKMVGMNRWVQKQVQTGEPSHGNDSFAILIVSCSFSSRWQSLLVGGGPRCGTKNDDVSILLLVSYRAAIADKNYYYYSWQQ
jgi:hypothetical protein